MTKIGKLYTCDRCGKTGFAECNGPMQRNGLIDPLGSYYKKLEGWEIWEGKNLCPDCAREYHQRLSGFWPEKEETK